MKLDITTEDSTFRTSHQVFFANANTTETETVSVFLNDAQPRLTLCIDRPGIGVRATYSKSNALRLIAALQQGVAYATDLETRRATLIELRQTAE